MKLTYFRKRSEKTKIILWTNDNHYWKLVLTTKTFSQRY